MKEFDWIAVDWGTTHWRAWALGPDGEILDHRTSDDGMGVLEPHDFEPALLRLIEPWLDNQSIDVVACGMVGARQGWVEAPYRTVPCQPLGAPFIQAPTNDSRLRVHIVPGLNQFGPADVMRGEETQIAGALAKMPGFEGTLILPGTHTKWVRIKDGKVVEFRSFMTGEVFDLLAKSSVLRHSVGNGWDQEAFLKGVTDALLQPESITTRLFSLRAQELLESLSPSAARARLSGILIGTELAGAKAYWAVTPVALLGADRLVDAYAEALGSQGVDCRRLDAGELTRKGLISAWDLKDRVA